MGLELTTTTTTTRERADQLDRAAAIATQAEQAITAGCIKEALALRDALVEGDLYGRHLAAGIINMALAVEAMQDNAFLSMIRRRLGDADRAAAERAAELGADADHLIDCHVD